MGLKIPLFIISIFIIIWIMAQFKKINSSFEGDDIPPENAAYCDAVITEVEHYSTAGGRSTGTTLYIRYTYDNTEYNEKIYAGFTLDDYSEGQILHMTVDKTDPHNAYVNEEPGSGSPDYLTRLVVIAVVCSFAVIVGTLLKRTKVTF